MYGILDDNLFIIYPPLGGRELISTPSSFLKSSLLHLI